MVTKVVKLPRLASAFSPKVLTNWIPKSHWDLIILKMATKMATEMATKMVPEAEVQASQQDLHLVATLCLQVVLINIRIDLISPIDGA